MASVVIDIDANGNPVAGPFGRELKRVRVFIVPESNRPQQPSAGQSTLNDAHQLGVDLLDLGLSGTCVG